MSTNQNTTSFLPPATVGDSTLASAADMLIVSTFFTALLVPIVVVLFFFSTPQSRRSAIFILNVLAITFGMLLGGVIIYTIRVRLALQPLDPAWTSTEAALLVIVPFLVESILLFRVVAVYPPTRLSWSRIFTIYGPILAVKIARLVNNAISIAKMTEAVANGPIGGLDAGAVAWSLPYAKVEWFLQLFDNTYVSALFIFRLREGQALSARHTANDSVLTSQSRDSYTSRLKTLAYIAVSNFVFPVIFNVVQLILIFRDRNYVYGVSVLFANNSVVIIGVLLATIWRSSERQLPSTNASSGTEIRTLPLTFGTPPTKEGQDTTSRSTSASEMELRVASPENITDIDK